MAFTGTAVVTQVSDRKIRITGLSLAGSAVGTISLSGGTGEVLMPGGFQPVPYSLPGASGPVTVALQDSVEVNLVPVTSITTLVPIEVVKTGTTPVDFLITLTNTTSATTSALQEIYIEFH